MTALLSDFPDPFEFLARLPVVVMGLEGGIILSPEGEVTTHNLATLKTMVRHQDFLICNHQLTSRRLDNTPFRAFDILELYAFIRPAQFCLPLPFGLAQALDLNFTSSSPEEDAVIILHAAQSLFHQLGHPEYTFLQGAVGEARQMTEAGWPWGPLIIGGLQGHPDTPHNPVWNQLPEWQEIAPPPPPGIEPVSESESLCRLRDLLGPNAEERQNQKTYTALATGAFTPPESDGEPRIILAEAGTGIGKTLGYIAPASLWAEKNDGIVWLTTYTKNLQQQLDQELTTLYPDPKVKQQKVVIRKGRENYLCLLNLQELFQRATGAPGRILLGLVSRWARYSRDGDMVGGDFPAWLGENFGRNRLAQLTDRRGECIYSACAHYRRCYIEKIQRKAKTANLVIANHALVMTQAAYRAGERALPDHYVFDEGHHLFDAADGVFSTHLTGQEGLELRRWIRGAEQTRRRGKGLKGRIEDLISDDDEARRLMEQIITTARCLPAEGWHGRLTTGGAFGTMEKFLSLVRQQIFARTKGKNPYHSLETPADKVSRDLMEAADKLRSALGDLGKYLKNLAIMLLKKLDKAAAELDSNTRGRFESVARTLTRRSDILTGGWVPMLEKFTGPGDLEAIPCVDWFELDRRHGREIDIGMHRHWIDPSQPFAETVLKPAQGVVITSATLRDRSEDNNPDTEWQMAEVRTGAAHLINPPRRQSLKSPFNYAEQSLILIVNDLNKNNLDQLAAAYRELMLAACGGTLGIFTAISRLRAVHQRLANPLMHHHIPLYAQHVDPINITTLIDIFRAIEDSCLLGTDAVRDGVDVPGPSLRLCVFDRVPWPRPTILHKARREKFGKQAYDDLITRLRLKQAYGRLIRRRSDRGVFVMLDGATPSRLLTAFPQEVVVERLGLAEAIRKTRLFLENYSDKNSAL